MSAFGNMFIGAKMAVSFLKWYKCFRGHSFVTLGYEITANCCPVCGCSHIEIQLESKDRMHRWEEEDG